MKFRPCYGDLLLKVWSNISANRFECCEDILLKVWPNIFANRFEIDSEILKKFDGISKSWSFAPAMETSFWRSDLTYWLQNGSILERSKLEWKRTFVGLNRYLTIYSYFSNPRQTIKTLNTATFLNNVYCATFSIILRFQRHFHIVSIHLQSCWLNLK